MTPAADYPTFSDTIEIERAVTRIAKALKQRRADFLFGAGMSAESGAPTGRQVALKLLEAFFPPSASPTPSPDRRAELVYDVPFEALAGAVESVLGRRRDDLTELLKELLVTPRFRESTAHQDLAQCCFGAGAPPLVTRLFTTNFDDILDRLLGKAGVRITEDNTRDIGTAQRAEQVPIVYLHGTLESGKYQVTETDVFAAGFKAVEAAFQSALNESDAFVFVGYSMSDPDFRRVYMSYREQLLTRQKNEKDTYMVMPIKDQFSYAMARKVCTARGSVLIPTSAAVFFAKLKTALQDGMRADEKVRIMIKYKLPDDVAFEDKLKRVAELLGVQRDDAVQFLLSARGPTGARS